MNKDDITFDVVGIAHLLSSDILVVPSNQREYSWIRDVQVRSFMVDINKQCLNRAGLTS
jgi:hypothetical protein